jgi:hypothetical protein
LGDEGAEDSKQKQRGFHLGNVAAPFVKCHRFLGLFWV